jgi:hypothetical protein
MFQGKPQAFPLFLEHYYGILYQKNILSGISQKHCILENIYLKTCLIIAASLTGLLCGASLDQSIKQLPARHIIGVTAFSAYAKAADLKNGVLWYAILGIGAALASIVTAILAWKYHTPERYALPLYLGGLFAISHSICTMLAAPAYHLQKRINDEEALRRLFNRFERIQTFRSIFIALNFLAYIWVYFKAL